MPVQHDCEAITNQWHSKVLHLEEQMVTVQNDLKSLAIKHGNMEKSYALLEERVEITEGVHMAIRLQLLRHGTYFDTPRADLKDVDRDSAEAGYAVAHGPNMKLDCTCIESLKHDTAPGPHMWDIFQKWAARLYGCKWGHMKMLTEPTKCYKNLSEDCIVLPPEPEMDVCRLFWTYHFLLWSVRVDITSQLRRAVEQTYECKSPIQLEYLPCDQAVADRLRREADVPTRTISDCEKAAWSAVYDFLEPYFNHNHDLQNRDVSQNWTPQPLSSIATRDIILFIRLAHEAYMEGFDARSIPCCRSDKGLWAKVEGHYQTFFRHSS